MSEATTSSRKRGRDKQPYDTYFLGGEGSLDDDTDSLCGRSSIDSSAPGREGKHTPDVPCPAASSGTAASGAAVATEETGRIDSCTATATATAAAAAAAAVRLYSLSSPAAAGSSVPTKEGDSRQSSGRSACCCSRVRKGMVILKGFLYVEEQRQLAAHVHQMGANRQGGFFSCNNEKTKRMRMMNLGLRTDGSRHILGIPRAWTDVATRACRLAAEIDPSIPVLRPDICVVNHYSAASRLGWHQDLFSSRDPGLPVVSLSLGQSATFQYRVSWKKTAGVKSITLESGDALIFGGRSRGIIHGVPGIGNAAAAVAMSKPAEAVSSSTVVGVRSKDEGAPGEETTCSSRPCSVPDGGRYNLNFREL